MRLKTKTKKALESQERRVDEAELLEVVADLVKALRGVRNNLANDPRLSMQGLDAAIARGESALKKHG